jgi:cyclophilin family peptidyl-prolyl cis-trans isomerase
MSIYGPRFPDEYLRFRMEKRGLLAMANSGKDSNNS